MPKGYQEKTAKKGLKAIAAMERSKTPFVITKFMEATGLDFYASTDFFNAVTHGYNEKDNGFNLARMYDVDASNYLTQRETRNPKDNSLLVLVRSAMNQEKSIRINKRELKLESKKFCKKHAKSNPQPLCLKTLSEYTNEELIAELQSRLGV